ncbi:hypothetical protein T07_10574 [Trichinella nelsoni]|uniref:Uncharacterized protein n=1 Tax=Trichinella nelsoni TaxID=6336 RepID=A0A0V0RNC9_9BILA|nr:hypothetical protein T07_10574 [Trichinella nelsoni]
MDRALAMTLAYLTAQPLKRSILLSIPVTLDLKQYPQYLPVSYRRNRVRSLLTPENIRLQSQRTLLYSCYGSYTERNTACYAGKIGFDP